MPGLIYAPEYAGTKERLSAEAGLEEALDAVEWELMHAPDFSKYPVVARHSQPVHYCATAATDWAPSVIVVFTFERFGEESKILMLDAKVAEPSEDDG